MQALVRFSRSLSRTISIANRTWLGWSTSTTQKPISLTLAREQSDESVNGEEEHFRDFQSLGHRPIILPKVQTSINLVSSPQGRKGQGRTWTLEW